MKNDSVGKKLKMWIIFFVKLLLRKNSLDF